MSKTKAFSIVASVPLFLTILWGVVGGDAPASADPPAGRGGGGGGALKLCVTFDDMAGDGFQSDWDLIGATAGANPYCDSKRDKIAATLGGSFSVTVSTANNCRSGRALYFDLTDCVSSCAPPNLPDECGGGPGLDELGYPDQGHMKILVGKDVWLALGEGETMSATLRVYFWFENHDWNFIFGPNDPATGLSCGDGDEVVITRLADAGSKRRWRIEALPPYDRACLFETVGPVVHELRGVYHLPFGLLVEEQ